MIVIYTINNKIKHLKSDIFANKIIYYTAWQIYFIVLNNFFEVKFLSMHFLILFI